MTISIANLADRTMNLPEKTTPTRRKWRYILPFYNGVRMSHDLSQYPLIATQPATRSGQIIVSFGTKTQEFSVSERK